MRILATIADHVTGHPRACRVVFGGLILAAALATAWGATHLQTDYLALLPRHKPEVKVFRETIRDFGSLDYLLVLLEAPEGHGADEYEDLAERLAGEIRASPHVAAVEYKVDTESPLVQFMASQSLLFLDREEREELASRLTPEGIRAQLRRDRVLLKTPTSSVMKRLVKLDPLGLLQIVKSHFVSGKSSHGIDFSQGYYLSRDRSALLLIVKPRRPAQDVTFSEKLLADVTARAGDALRSLEELPPPALHYGGGYVVALEDYKILKRDAAINVSSSFVSVLILFAVGMGRVRAVKYAAIPLFSGILLTGGFGALALGSFNPATAGFAALLVGLTVDYIIVMYGRFSEERRAGTEVHAAVRTIIEQTGRSVFWGCITTAATFLALCTVDFKGLFDLGLLTGVGVLICFLAIVYLVPLLLQADGERHHETFARPVRSFGIEKIALLARRSPRAMALLGAVATAAAASQVPHVGFDDNVKALRAKGNKGIEVQRLVAKKFGGGFDYLMVITRAGSMEELLERSVDVNGDLDRLVREEVLAGYDSAVKYLPPRSVQDENLAWLREQRRGFMNPERIRETFEQALREEGFRTEPFQRSLDLVLSAISVDEPLTPAVLERHDLGFVVDRYFKAEESGVKSVTYVFPQTGDFKRFVPEGLLAIARARPGVVELSGVTVISQALRGEIKRQSTFALVLGLALVAGLVALEFRSAALSLVVMAPLVCGVLWMCGLMRLFGVSFNFFNVFVATMILGIGVDYGIHATHRYFEGNGRDFDGAFLETGKSIVLAALTTILGFGSFATSHYRGLYSMGMVAIIGTSTCLLACLTVLPALLVWLHPPAPATTAPPENV